jgi:flagellar hook assembly protein FlgD
MVAVGNQNVPTFRLLGGSPNPFNPRTQIHFELAENETVDLAVFDARGCRVSSLARGTWPAGRHSVSWDGRDERGRALASGVYFVRLLGSQTTDVQPVTLIR